MNLIFGYFDWILLTIIIIVNIYYWRKLKPLKGCLKVFSLIILFGLILPFFSMVVEIQLYSSPEDDSFNLLYTYFRFPAYWTIGIIQLIIIFIGSKNQNL